MQNQRGNFLMQALLALTLIFAFIPFIAGRLVAREMDAQMYATTRQVMHAQSAARIFVRENAGDFPYETTVLLGQKFTEALEPYGLPLGFIPRTALGQDISLVIFRDAMSVSAYLELSGANLSELELSELARRIGFYASQNGDVILVGLALDDVYSDVVYRNETNLENSAFLTELNMGGFSLQNVADIVLRRGEFDSAQFGTLTISGIESGSKERNNIENLSAGKTVFQSALGESALSVTRGGLAANSVNVRTVSRYGDTGAFVSNTAGVYDFSMTAGRTGFVGPADWTVHGNLIADRANFTTERLEISSYLDTARGQDVYINPDSLEYSSRSGISTSTITASNITMRDQTSDAMSRGESGAVVLDLRPAGTSLLPDVLVNDIDNGDLVVIAEPSANDNKTINCQSIISDLEGVYNRKSLSQYIICQYLYWHRIEQRIDIKKCLMDGGSGCM